DQRTLSLRTLGNLRIFGFLTKKWQETEYPKIAKRAKREGALIFFADEAGIRSDHPSGTTWATKGGTPVVKATRASFGMNMLSAVNAHGHFRFMTVQGTVTATVFRDFLSRLISGVNQKIFLIVDGHPTHKAKLVKQFVADNKESIELFFLPPYSPRAQSRRARMGKRQSQSSQICTDDKG